MSEPVQIALIGLASAVIVALITAVIGPVVTNRITKSSGSGSVTAPGGLNWRFGILGAVIGALIAVVPLVTYA
ncbi:hypothetical protein EKD04_016565 [Chloroflexales bacterium ZM16-3]|nr:hypothetical protein [Chloroflexales bacterium ZM16-3]